MTEQIAAIIPARGGSVRVKDKNTRPFAGKSLLRWSVIQAINSIEIDRAYVVTDSHEIASQGMGEGAEIIWQPEWQCQLGVSGGTVATLWAIDVIRKLNFYKHFVVLLPVTPTRKPNDIDDAIGLYRKSGQWYLGSRGAVRHPGFFHRMGENRSIPLGPFKEGGYLTYSHVFSIAHLESWINQQYQGADSIDFEKFRDPTVPASAAPAKLPIPDIHYEVEPWQLVDIDEWADFKAAETVFCEMILKGNDRVYEEYRERKLNGHSE